MYYKDILVNKLQLMASLDNFFKVAYYVIISCLGDKSSCTHITGLGLRSTLMEQNHFQAKHCMLSTLNIDKNRFNFPFRIQSERINL